MPVVFAAFAAAGARISARTTALVESCQLLTRGQTHPCLVALGDPDVYSAGATTTILKELQVFPHCRSVTRDQILARSEGPVWIRRNPFATGRPNGGLRRILPVPLALAEVG
jgi:hypothetical protein